MDNVQRIIESVDRSKKSIDDLLKRINAISIAKENVKIFEIELAKLYSVIEIDGKRGKESIANKNIGNEIKENFGNWLDDRKSKFIYIFQVDDKKAISDIVEAIKFFKEDQSLKQVKITIPNDNGSEFGNCLYLGKSKKDLISRIKAHLGIPATTTFAMRLYDLYLHRSNKGGFVGKIKVTVLAFDNLSDVMLNLLEAILAHEFKPALGEHEDID